MLNPRDRVEMLDLIGVQDKECAEVGVYDGWFSKQILAKNPSKLLMIDPWIHQPIEVYPDDHANIGDNQFNAIFEKIVSEFGCNNKAIIIRDFSVNAVQSIPYNSLDFVYIDAIHTFESTLCDALLWSQKVKKGGWICGHDYIGKYLGVQYAVEAFCRITKQQLELITNETWASWGIQLK